MPAGSSLFDRAYQWLDSRVPISSFVRYFGQKTVPRHKHSIWYYFGGLTLFFFVVQVITGIMLALYYRPSPDAAHESVRHIVNHVPFGWLVRSVHSWAANFMIATLFLHMFSAFFMRAYRKPRELMWLTGVLLMFIALGFGFTGYLLPWDTTAYFATLIGTEVPRLLPIIGDWGVSLLKGSEEIGEETLTRMFSIHIIILPLITVFIMTLHVLLSQVLGSSIPIGTQEKKPPIRFFPNFLYRDIISWIVGLIALMTAAILLPWGLGEKADPLASAPVGIKPEWYFLPLYQSLKFVPAQFLSISGELIVNSLVVLASILWFCVPFLDRKASKEQKGRLFSIIGVLIVFYLMLTIGIAYAS